MVPYIEFALKSPIGTFAFISSLMALSYWMVWKVSHFATKFSTIQKLEESVDRIKEDLITLKGGVKLLTEYLNPLGQKKSPITLTELGQRLTDELNLLEMLAFHWEEIYFKISRELKEDYSVFDIQEISFSIGENYQEILSQKELRKIKEQAYQQGLRLEMYNLLFGILIRDKFLKLKGFKVEELVEGG